MKQKSLRQMARELGVSASYLSQVRHGKCPASNRIPSEVLSRVLSNQLPARFHEGKPLQSTEGGTRTHTPSREADFKSAASTVPPPRLLVPVRNAARGLQECKKAASGFEPLYRGFADPCLNLLATPPN